MVEKCTKAVVDREWTAHVVVSFDATGLAGVTVGWRKGSAQEQGTQVRDLDRRRKAAR